ncbi:MAG TPA: monovalent cation/H+ antiporter subunit D family protein, partial [Alphaproteobacteria bacterium]|nr:monovalent cation/H+ antiporter subunit D family protein [Alphaproteobacteria bacterium]
MIDLTAHLPALQVVVPLVAAPLCVLFARRAIAWALCFAASLAALLIAITLLHQVLAAGPISYALGGWAPPWGIEYRVDALNAYILLIIAAISTVVLLFGAGSVPREIPPRRQTLFYACYALCLTGLLGITITGDAFNVFVFLEISSLSTYALISMGTRRKALTAAFQYLVMGTIGATFILIGIGLLYMMTGTLNMADLAQRLHLADPSRPVLTAFAFITVGLALKAALFPLHLWLPNAYAFAPTVVTVFLAATATKVSVYVMIRILYTVFGGAPVFGDLMIDDALMGLGMLSMLAAGLVAVFQTNVKRLLAYSSVSQIGYMILGLSLGSVAGLAAGIIHIFNHAMMKAALFMAMGCAFSRAGVVSVDDLAGLGRRMPVTMAVIVIGSLSLIGVPLTVGFVTKWYLIQAAVEAGAWPAAIVVLASGLIAVMYTWRIVE